MACGGSPSRRTRPDPGSAESRRAASWRVGNPWWVGASNGIEARGVGHVSRIRASLVWSPEVRIPYRTPSAVSATGQPADRAARRLERRRVDPTCSAELRAAIRLAIIHHTAGQNDYTRAQAPAIVRGIELFHVKGNGWNDIGYNFLVDRFGTIYEGRYGGVDRNVIGAHALGFNTGSVGIALLGTYGSTKPSAGGARRDRAHRLLEARPRARRSDVVPHVHLRRQRALPERHPGPVERRVGPPRHGPDGVSGDALYAKLGSIAAAARALGGPKIFDPRADAAEASVRFRAGCRRHSRGRSSSPTRRARRSRAGPGTGTAVDWTWEWSGRAGRSTRGRSRPEPRVPRPACCAPGVELRPCARRPVCRARRDQPERRRPGGHGDASRIGSPLPRT